MVMLVHWLFLFISLLALTCMLVLFALARNRRHKVGYLMLMVTFLIWDWLLYSLPQRVAAGWLYLVPVVWLIVIFRYGFPSTTPHHFPPQPGEPLETQEALQGAPATREALTFYFLLLMIGAIVMLLFLYTAQFYT
jgi:hypothetical protein